MTRQTLIKQTLQILSKLPINKVQEVADFADFLSSKYDEQILQKGTEKLVSDSKTFKFLNLEEDLYTVSDLKEKYRLIEKESQMVSEESMKVLSEFDTMKSDM